MDINDEDFFKLTQEYASSNSSCPIRSKEIVGDDALELIQRDPDLHSDLYAVPRQPDEINAYSFKVKVTAKGGAQYESEWYTLKVGCLPDEV